MSISSAIKSLNKKYGDDTIMLGDCIPKEISSISTGSIALDRITGIGGFPVGRITEVFGIESAGKSTLCLNALSDAQKKGGTCVYIDVEHAISRDYAENLGVDMDKVLMPQPSSAEQALEIMRAFSSEKDVSLIILDSVAALASQAELDKGMDESTMANVARLMGKCIREITPNINNNDICVVFVNQLRSNIGTYGGSEITPGGKSLKYAATLRLRMSAKKGTANDHNIVTVHTVKNKLSNPNQTATFNIVYGEGVDNTDAYLDIAIDKGLITNTSMSYYYDGEKIAVGRANAVEYIKNNLLDKIK